MDKKAMMGEGMTMIYRILLVVFIAFVILGCSALFYSYYLDVKDTEAVILSKNLVSCVIQNSILDLTKLQGKENTILDYCGIKNIQRFYVKLNVTDYSGKQIAVYMQGDSSAKWVKEIIDSNNAVFLVTDISKILKYRPGYGRQEYNVFLDAKHETKGKLLAEVFVSSEL